MDRGLFEKAWDQIDPVDLRILLDEHFGGPGQYADREAEAHRFYLPLAGSSCRVTLTFVGPRIVAIEPGPAFDPLTWTAFQEDVEASCLSGRAVVAREYAFSSFRVPGFWRGEHSGVQILPPHPEAPVAEVELAEHPFILEFPILHSSRPGLVNHRRFRVHRRLARLLNLLLVGRVSYHPRQVRHLWATDRSAEPARIKWVQEFYFAPLGEPVTSTLSTPTFEPLQELPPDQYQRLLGHDGKPLRVPADLDANVLRYLHLPTEQRRSLDRATFWLDLASRQWYSSISASFAALVSAVEALTDRGSRHGFDCPVCGQKTSHEVPGATRRFREFFEMFAPGDSFRRQRGIMYALRSGILHGSTLMQFDEAHDFGWDPPGWHERELHSDLWVLTRAALRRWLARIPDREGESRDSSAA